VIVPEVLFLLSAGILLYTYALYPLGVALVGRWSKGSRHTHTDERHLPMLTLLISAYNEETVIERKLRNTLALDYPRDQLEVVVASESSDGTDAIVRQFESEGIQLRNFSGQRLGKSATIQRVMPSVRGDIVVFSDANALYRADALRKVARNFADATVGCVIGQLRYRDASSSVGGRGELVYWVYDRWFRQQAARVKGLVPGINGSLFAIRRELYFPFSEQRGDDYELCTRIAIRGHAAVFEPEAIAEEPSDESTPQQFRRKVRLVRWNIMSSWLLAREAFHLGAWRAWVQVVSQRMLRYFAPVWLLVALAGSGWLAMASPLFLGIFGLQIAFYLVALAGWLAEAAHLRLPRVCLIPSYFLMVNSAAAVAIVTGLGRGQQTTWTKQR
jgi:cellulose synthase/poly-beta-1,6-N-acetylglucosamine synthase-like glycosyltransferase